MDPESTNPDNPCLDATTISDGLEHQKVETPQEDENCKGNYEEISPAVGTSETWSEIPRHTPSFMLWACTICSKTLSLSSHSSHISSKDHIDRLNQAQPQSCPPQPTKTLIPTWYCEICEGEVNLLYKSAHLSGRKHAKLLREKEHPTGGSTAGRGLEASAVYQSAGGSPTGVDGTNTSGKAVGTPPFPEKLVHTEVPSMNSNSVGDPVGTGNELLNPAMEDADNGGSSGLSDGKSEDGGAQIPEAPETSDRAAYIEGDVPIDHKPRPNTTWECIICEKVMQESSKKSHEAGAKHQQKKRMSERPHDKTTAKRATPSQQRSSIQQEVSDQHPQALPKISDDSGAELFHCTVCDRRIVAWCRDEHLASKDHKRKEARGSSQPVDRVYTGYQLGRYLRDLRSREKAEAEAARQRTVAQQAHTKQAQPGDQADVTLVDPQDGTDEAESQGLAGDATHESEGQTNGAPTAVATETAVVPTIPKIYCDICKQDYRESRRPVHLSRGWHCNVCDHPMHIVSKRAHLAGKKHAKKLALQAGAST